MGVDRAILIESIDTVQTDRKPLVLAKLLASVVREKAPGLVADLLSAVPKLIEKL